MLHGCILPLHRPVGRLTSAPGACETRPGAGRRLGQWQALERGESSPPEVLMPPPRPALRSLFPLPAVRRQAPGATHHSGHRLGLLASSEHRQLLVRAPQWAHSLRFCVRNSLECIPQPQELTAGAGGCRGGDRSPVTLLAGLFTSPPTLLYYPSAFLRTALV